MRKYFTLILLSLFTISAYAQIKIPKANSSSPSAVPKTAVTPSNRTPDPVQLKKTTSVDVAWLGSQTVVINIENQSYPFTAGSRHTLNLEYGKVLKLKIETPAQTYTASEFLLLEQAGGTLEINIRNGSTVFFYETPVQTQLRKKAAEEKMLERESNIKALFESTLVTVQGGIYEMGSETEDRDEKPVHRVNISSFFIGKFEVTQGQWKAIMDKNPSEFKGCDECPVERVSWNDVQSFLGKLNQLTGKNYRLPTEAEWEYAARGGSVSKGYNFSGSNFLNEVAWFGDNSDSKTHPVGQKLPNELGLYDMSGNVDEFCSDWYGESYYSISPEQNPKGLNRGEYKVVRGGSWYYNKENCRISNRLKIELSDSFNVDGFRLALDY